MTAQKIIQQIWAQACIKDLTYIVLHSGNCELICIRNRSSQTLYCSRLLERCKNNIPYGPVQVGGCLAAVNHAINRFRQGNTGGGAGRGPTTSGSDIQTRRKSGRTHTGNIAPVELEDVAICN
ncbi:hypothetical protein K503DRAFT_373895 [Rhizopogon vinicolor AM-OR11-026]|uniref:Uncharacterized protein n=1 Tax=Rhizopogon vinicolor AM-OR11-026 TaxID=1314800 RepID=A0A1B7MRW6_9AGAM|nr:hypothetical protein K503DRAFT_373895 [Rhizopogon vinicolor AM-OR11-026]